MTSTTHQPLICRFILNTPTTGLALKIIKYEYPYESKFIYTITTSTQLDFNVRGGGDWVYLFVLFIFLNLDYMNLDHF